MLVVAYEQLCRQASVTGLSVHATIATFTSRTRQVTCQTRQSEPRMRKLAWDTPIAPGPSVSARDPTGDDADAGRQRTGGQSEMKLVMNRKQVSLRSAGGRPSRQNSPLCFYKRRGMIGPVEAKGGRRLHGQRTDRSSARHAGSAHPQNPRTRAAARLGCCRAHTADFKRRPEDSAGVALPGPAPSRAARLGARS